MRKRCYNAAKIKHEVYAARKRKKGKKYILKPLSAKERADLESNFSVVPWLYRVKLVFPYAFRPTDSTASIIKQLWFYKKQTGNYVRYMHLNPNQVEICRDFGLEVRLEKYKIS